MWKKLSWVQKRALSFVIAKKGRALLALKAGLGKSMVALMALEHFSPASFPCIIVSPGCVVEHWVHEAEKWLGLLHVPEAYKKKGTDVLPAAGDNGTQIVCIKSGKDALVDGAAMTIMSYDMFIQCVRKGLIQKLSAKFKSCVVDESHMLQDEFSLRTRVISSTLNRYHVPLCILLTGTIGDHSMQVWPQLKLLRPDVFKDRNAFGNKFCGATRKCIGYDHQKKAPRYAMDFSGSSNHKELFALMTSTCVFTDSTTAQPGGAADAADPKDQTLAAPPKDPSANDLQETTPTVMTHSSGVKFTREFWVIPLKPGTKQRMDIKWGRLSKKDKEDGEKSLAFMQQYMHTMRTKAKFVPTVFDQYIWPLFTQTPRQQTPALKTAEGTAATTKKRRLEPTRDAEGQPANKFLFFAYNVDMMETIARVLTERKIKYIYIRGGTTPQVRDRLIADFQDARRGSPVAAVLSIKSVGKGVPFTAANFCFFFQTTWIGSDLLQAEARTVRRGQRRQVRLVHLRLDCAMEEHQWGKNMTTIATQSKNLQDASLGEFQYHTRTLQRAREEEKSIQFTEIPQPETIVDELLETTAKERDPPVLLGKEP
jgi:hypothetical protein